MPRKPTLDPVSVEYHGTKIHFDGEKEVWYIVMEGKRTENKSIKLIQTFIDRMKKKAFERIPVFVRERGGYYSRGDRKFVKAMITSVGVDGTLFIVRDGSKSAEHGWGGYVQNESNAKLIKEIESLEVQMEKMKNEKEAKEKQLEEIDTDKIRESVLGKNWRGY